MPIPAPPQPAPGAPTALAAPLAMAPEPPGGATALEEIATPFDMPQIEAQIDTAFGGLFYLLNLALELELYGDFTRPADLGIALPIWDFLAQVGLELLGQPLRADPIWALLARLADSGRRRAKDPRLRLQRPPTRPSDNTLSNVASSLALEDAPGQDFAPPEDWRIPPAWLAPFPAPAVLRCSGEADRLRVAHPAGFALLDIARNGDPQQLSAELRAYGPDLSCTPDLLPWPAAPASPLDRWLGWLMPYLFARLRRALGEHGDQEIAELVCAHQARVRLATARLDIVLSLAELPIAIRLCGLDRDPGWIPAAGRVVAFHFE